MERFAANFSVQSRIMFWCSLIVKHSETRHMLITQNVYISGKRQNVASIQLFDNEKISFDLLLSLLILLFTWSTVRVYHGWGS
jgi:hypothetical protein